MIPEYESFLAELPDWANLLPTMRARLEGHGDYPRWRAALDALPPATVESSSFGDTVTLDGDMSSSHRQHLEELLQALHPWRKGPFRLFGVFIDSEWRSDFKWQRVAPHVNLEGHRVLDIGGGNGYFGWRMLEAGARHVVGIDPTVVFCMQHAAVNHYLQRPDNRVLPLAFEELDNSHADAAFDTVFSMGVIYHRRDPLEHLQHIRRCLAPGGRVVLESLVVADEPLTPRRYARMRNVWHVPTPALLCAWLSECGFVDAEILDVTPTTTDEQRSTPWMRFESLREALDPNDTTRTIEGHPAPARCLVTATTSC